jgi:hypothetical protein
MDQATKRFITAYNDIYDFLRRLCKDRAHTSSTWWEQGENTSGDDDFLRHSSRP